MNSHPHEEPLLPPINDGQRPSRLDLSRRAAGEDSLAGTSHADLAGGAPQASAWLRSIEAERARTPEFDFEILRAHAERLADSPAADPLLEGTAPLAGRSAVEGAARRRPTWWHLALTLSAFCAVFFFLPSSGPTNSGSLSREGVKGGLSASPGMPTAAGRTTREAYALEQLGSMSAGQPQAEVAILRVIVERDGKLLKGRHNNEVFPGDLVGFRCFSAAYDRVTLLAIDPAGVVTAVDGGGGLVAVSLRTQERQDLNFHLQVTPPVNTTLMAFFGEWTPDNIRATVGAAWSKGGNLALDELAEDHDDIELVTLHTP